MHVQKHQNETHYTLDSTVNIYYHCYFMVI